MQKRTTKILRLFSLSKTERHLVEVSHKCFFPGRKYERIKGEREKAQGETEGPNQRLPVGPWCPCCPKTWGCLQAPPHGHVPSPPSRSHALSLKTCFFSGARWTLSPCLLGQLRRLRTHFPMIAAPNLLFLAERPLLCC